MFQHLRFGHRIAVLVVLAGVALVTVTVVTIVLGRRSEQELSSIETRYVPLIELDRDLKAMFAQIARTLEDAAAAAEGSGLDTADTQQGELVQRLRAGREAIRDNGSDPDVLERELRLYYAVARDLAKAIITGAPLAELETKMGLMRRARDAFKTRLDLATAPDRRRLAAAFSTARGSQQDALRIEVAVAVGALVLMALLSWRITRRTVTSLLAVSEGVERLARGDFGNEIAVASRDEIGDLARQANQTALRLRDYRDRTETLLTETQRQAEQLRMANETVELRNASLLLTQQQLEDRARELERANLHLEQTTTSLHDKIADLEDVSNTLSHDLRAPLRSIRGFSQILAESLHDNLDDSARDALERVLRGSERMGRMLDDLYRLLRLSGADVSTGEVAVAAVLDDVIQNLRTDLDQAGATITHDELPALRGNGMLIGQILQNLISNAINFRGVNPPMIHIGATPHADEWEFAVQDNGIGIQPDAHERVFRLFERLTSRGTGTGVGLTLCKRAVEKLGGRIWVGAHSGPGATFLFTIPHHQRRASD
jgi:signal transduction histidine kinase